MPGSVMSQVELLYPLDAVLVLAQHLGASCKSGAGEAEAGGARPADPVLLLVPWQGRSQSWGWRQIAHPLAAARMHAPHHWPG